MKLHLVVNGQAHELDAPPMTRLLDALRNDLGLTGTKEGCGEGECGACSVILDGEVINSCLVPVKQVNGSRVTTVEGLASDGRLDPIQKAFLECGGAQCGICTPGMLIAARALLDANPHPTREEIKEGIAGNLCRCTGYVRIFESIEKAALEIDTPKPASQQRGQLRAPKSLSEALAILSERGKSLKVIAGGTDLMVLMNAHQLGGEEFLDIWGIAELRGIRDEGDYLKIGALTTYTDLIKSPLIQRHIPVLVEASRTVGAVQIQNRGTIGGNVVNASPAGDTLPVLAAFDAEIEIGSARGVRIARFNEFYTGYRQTTLVPDELVLAIRIAKLREGERAAFYKVGTRRAQAISKVVMALRARIDGNRVDSIGIGIGSVAPTVIRAACTENLLNGSPLTAALIERARQEISLEVKPISDLRSTERYRRWVTGSLLGRFLEGLGDLRN
jgi:xanthine dehydrogenase iron-sulfur cluster and FAD-binding subunit A